MNPVDANEARDALRAWLRNEQRLGVSHWATPMPVSRAISALPESAPPRELRQPTTTPQSLIERDLPPTREPATQRDNAHRPLDLLDDGDLPPLCDRELDEADARAALQELDSRFVRGCRKCVLCEQRTQTVFGVGRARPEVVFVGEGPGADEDREGIPFVGRAGQLLTRMIAAMTLTRDQVYICNVVKCRPPQNRTPEDSEMAACSPYLFRQLAILKPRIIVTLGRPATQMLLATKETISKLRGRMCDFPPIALRHVGLPACKLIPTFHPAYLLRSPQEKGKAWEDLQEVMRFLGIPIPRRSQTSYE